ncbi:MAG: VCBS repeat-containing protein [Planctomycetaceae bacterium]|nr:VCBS repeat-containing protein [Planctomycetaceae bacterium]
MATIRRLLHLECITHLTPRQWRAFYAGRYAWLLLALTGCGPGPGQLPQLNSVSTREPATADLRETERRIAAFCGDCHALPRPESFSRDRWYVEVRKGYEFYAKSGRTDLDPPPLHETLTYFRARSPEELSFPAPNDVAEDLPVKFSQEHLYLNSPVNILPEIAHLNWVQLSADSPPVLVACDMRYGHVVAIDVKQQGRAAPRFLALLRNPCRAEPCDLDADGTTDLVVADLGSFQPAEHDRGRVVWLRRRQDKTEYEVTELQAGLGRVADVRAEDVDGDEKLDLIVAVFGWQQTGGILWLRNISTEADQPRFEMQPIDDRPGAIHVPAHDFDGDGRADFMALISQEYEAVDLFINVGGGRFQRRNIWAAPDLTFGFSGIELVDLDRDGDRDILYTNGDAFDNHIASPWHGVQWLENCGGLAFQYHRLTDMSGAYRALAADFDRDGDEDVLAVVFLPRNVQPASLRGAQQPSIVFLEQATPGQFRRHTLERGSPNYATLAIADFDSDGDPDFAVASGPTIAEDRLEKHYLTVWWNQIANEPAQR